MIRSQFVISDRDCNRNGWRREGGVSGMHCQDHRAGPIVLQFNASYQDRSINGIVRQQTYSYMQAGVVICDSYSDMVTCSDLN